MFPKFAFPLQGHVITSDDDDAIVGNDKSTRSQGQRVTFMQYDLGNFDDETCRLETTENPFGPKLLPIRSE
jgi:hypothetical protein